MKMQDYVDFMSAWCPKWSSSSHSKQPKYMLKSKPRFDHEFNDFWGSGLDLLFNINQHKTDFKAV